MCAYQNIIRLCEILKCGVNFKQSNTFYKSQRVFMVNFDVQFQGNFNSVVKILSERKQFTN